MRETDTWLDITFGKLSTNAVITMSMTERGCDECGL